jgi:hypothetical protein
MSLFAFLVMPRKASGCRIHYGRRPEFEAKEEKLTFLHNTDLNARRRISSGRILAIMYPMVGPWETSSIILAGPSAQKPWMTSATKLLA